MATAQFFGLLVLNLVFLVFGLLSDRPVGQFFCICAAASLIVQISFLVDVTATMWWRQRAGR